jgi:hypothetical protein
VIETNQAWDDMNVLLGKRPIYAFTIGQEARVYCTADLAACGVTDPPADSKAWLKIPRGASQTIDVLNGQSSIGELEIEVIEQGGAVRQLVGGETLEGRSATLTVGYPGIAYSEFVVLATYQLYKILPSRGYTSWIFRARDRQMNAKRTVWTHPENGLALEASNPWIMQGTPGEIAQAVYLWALGRGVEDIDRAAFVALDAASEGLHQMVRPFLFVLMEPFEAKQFLETEIYKVCGLYPVVDNLGRISVRPPRAPAAGVSGAFEFDEDNIIVLPEIDRMPILNEMIFRLDYEEGEFQNEIIYVDGASVSAYGRGTQQVIESRGLRTVLGAQWICEEVASRMFRRFAGVSPALRGGAPVITVEAFLLTLPVWVGDYVLVTHSLMPDILTGALGVTDRVFEVVDREPDYSGGRMKYRLLDTGLTGLAAAHLFAESARNFIIGTSEVF